MVLPHQVSTSNIRQVQWKCQDCPMKRQWLWISLCKRPNTVNGVWWQFSLRKNEDITSTWLVQLTATSDMTALDHFITCCSLEHYHPHLSCTPLPTVLSLRGIFIHEENIRENIQLTMTGLAVDPSWLNSSYTEILPTAFGWITANDSAAFLKSFIRHRYRSWVGYFSGFNNRVIDML